MAALYRDPQVPKLSSPIQEDDKVEIQQMIWKCPAPDLQHVGDLVVLRVEIPTFDVGSSNLPQTTSSKSSAWEVTGAELAEIVFCRLTVHKREAYKPRMELLKNGLFNGETGWADSS